MKPWASSLPVWQVWRGGSQALLGLANMAENGKAGNLQAFLGVWVWMNLPVSNHNHLAKPVLTNLSYCLDESSLKHVHNVKHHQNRWIKPSSFSTPLFRVMLKGHPQKRDI